MSEGMGPSAPAVSTRRMPASPSTTTGFRSGSLAASSICEHMQKKGTDVNSRHIRSSFSLPPPLPPSLPPFLLPSSPTFFLSAVTYGLLPTMVDSACRQR